MRKHVKNMFLLTALSIVGVTGWYLTNQDLPGTDELLGNNSFTTEVDAQGKVTGITLTQYDGDKLQWALSAPGANQRLSGWTEIRAPRLTLYTEDGDAIYISALSGRVHASTRAMEFLKDVQVTDQLQRRLTTDRLHFDAKKGELSSDRAFKLVGENIILEGVGLRLLKQARELHVLKRVRLIFLQGTEDLV
ncbi:LPS export ABC transporter periplasmic protein LptC [Magnetococcus sp. PR-3]|uniref:LPS export ABC transporter periplasmic protein LptC n=1 Tax=Magnetococcus sp. PR-3 TaxID=3120355 RepID=UPI002FCE1D04